MEDTKRLDYALLVLPQHLHEAGDALRLEKLLATFSFLDRKNRRFGPQAVINDFELTELASLAAVRDAIRLAAHVAGPDGDQLAGQLIARLLDQPEAEVRDLVRQAQTPQGARGCGRREVLAVSRPRRSTTADQRRQGLPRNVTGRFMREPT